MIDFNDLEEIDEDNAKMRNIAQSFSGNVKKWFHNLSTNSVNNSQRLIELFLGHWQEKKNPLQILAEFNSMNRNANETVQEFTTRFNLVYNSIPDDMKPPPGLALLHYPDAFDSDMAYKLKERDPTTLEEMQWNVVSVEANLLIKKSKSKHARTKKKFVFKEEASSSLDVNLDTLIKTMEKMMDRISITN